MKSSLKSLGAVLSSLGLFTISLSFSLPVKAAVACKHGTVKSYQNGSVESCTIENNVDTSAASDWHQRRYGSGRGHAAQRMMRQAPPRHQ